MAGLIVGGIFVGVFGLIIGTGEALNIMNAVMVLLAVNALIGLVLGLYFSWFAILVAVLPLAILTATVLQHEGFGSLAGFPIVIVCLSVNQIAYLIGVMLALAVDAVYLVANQTMIQARVATTTLPVNTSNNKRPHLSLFQ